MDIEWLAGTFRLECERWPKPDGDASDEGARRLPRFFTSHPLFRKKSNKV
jgi:hypothetical protein